MAYNLQSLITILEQILNPLQTRWILDHNKPHLESLLKTAASLHKILDYSSFPRIQSVETQIRDAAHQAEDIIELQMLDQMLHNPQAQGVMSFTFSTPDLQTVTQQLDSAMEKVADQLMNMSTGTGRSGSSSSLSIGASFSSSKSVVVGVDADLMQLKDQLTGTKSKLEIIPIVGMGGVGKTTLARKLYEDPLILYHFTCLAWTTISQDYNIEAVILGLLRCIIGNEVDRLNGKENDELGGVLHKSLFGRRYMIVLDDVWSTDFWDVVRKYFPDNDNGSRIMITTRELNVAKFANSQGLYHEVQLLSVSDSWNLLRQIVFEEEEEDCPSFLQEIGVKIANDCGGLPLAINVIGGLLSKIERSKDVWENIGKDVRAAIAESDKHKELSRILYLSYNHLPDHLKPCFLYMGAFPEDYEIKTFKLKCLWIAEGFVKSNGDKSLEEEAEDYLKALVERNLLMVRDFQYNGKPNKCIMHDMLRDVCINKADEDNFLHIMSNPEIVTCSSLRRLSVPTHKLYYGLRDASASTESISLCRSFLYTGLRSSYDFESPAFFALRLLRVLDVPKLPFTDFPREILQLVSLRYLALMCGKIPSGISKLCHLQTLIAKVIDGDVPSELLEMSELNHIMLSPGVWMLHDYMKKTALEKLETISYVGIDESVIERGLFENFPSIKSLGIRFGDDFGSTTVVNLSHHHSLETLRCYCYFRTTSKSYLSRVLYPPGLRKLVLENFIIPTIVLTTLCALPKLESLTIRRCVFETDGEWEVAEGDVFPSLVYLKLDDLNVVRWRADETNFPRLRHLFIRYCDSLQDIPSGIGEIAALQLIELRRCNHSVVSSAKQIQEMQQSELGDYTLQLRIYDTY